MGESFSDGVYHSSQSESIRIAPLGQSHEHKIPEILLTLHDMEGVFARFPPIQRKQNQESLAEGAGNSCRARVVDRRRMDRLSGGSCPSHQSWLPVSFVGDRPGPAGGLRFAAEPEPCLRDIRARLVSSPWVGAVRNDAGLTGTRFFCSPVFDDDRQVNLLLQSKEPVTYNPTIRS